MGGFMVNGKSNKLYSVTLFPKETCQCPAQGTCYHIIACKKSIGLPTNDKKKRIFSLTQLRKNARKKPDKKSGRKRPRIGDLDKSIICPAPDSVLSKTLNESEINEVSNLSYFTPKSKEKRTVTIINKTSTPHYEHIKDKQSNDLPSPIEDIHLSPETSTKQFSNNTPIIPKTPKSILKLISGKSTNDHSPKKRKLAFKNCSAADFDTNSNDLINACNISRSSDLCDTVLLWKPDLFLTENDKFDLLNDKKINSNHVEAVNILLRKKFGKQISGLVTTVARKSTSFFGKG